MDQRDLAQQDPETIRHRIDETRSSITEKLEALEEQVAGTVQNARESVEETIQTARQTVESAKETVEETIENVKSSVQQTVESVKRTFDLKHQVEQHPWPMMGVSFLAGVAGGVLYENLRGTREVRPHQASELRSEPGRQAAAAEPAGGGWRELFREEINKAQGIAVGYLAALARDWAKMNFPELAPQIHEFMDGLTEKLGAVPVEHDTLGDAYAEARLREESSPFSHH